MFAIHWKDTPTMRQLKHFEKDPTIAFLPMNMNSGQVRFAAAVSFFGAISNIFNKISGLKSTG